MDGRFFNIFEPGYLPQASRFFFWPAQPAHFGCIWASVVYGERSSSRSPIQCVVMDLGTERVVGDFVMNAVAGARRAPGRHKTGGVPPKPPATILSLSVALNVLGLWFVLP